MEAVLVAPACVHYVLPRSQPVLPVSAAISEETSQLVTSRQPAHNEPRREVPQRDTPQRGFQLLRYFSIASGIAVFIVTMVLSWAYYLKEVDDNVGATELRNLGLATAIANTIRPAYDEFLFQHVRSGTPLPDDPRRKDLTETLKRVIHGIPVVKIKIYTIDGVTIFSTDGNELGVDKRLNPLFQNARVGRTASELTRRGEKSKSEDEVATFDLVSTYIPITEANGKVAAVFELYSDVSEAVQRIERASLRLLAGLALIFASLYGILLLIVGRADRILRRQYRELKRKEMQLAAKNNELQIEIASRREVEIALRYSEKAAAKANQAKTEFLSSVSHELRTPLHAILGFTQLLESEPTTPLAPTQKRFVDQILKAGRHLLTLINEILDLASIEAGKIRLSVEPVDVASVVAECLPLVQEIAGRRGVGVATPAGAGNLRVLADYMKLKQALLNLMSNGVKYNHDGGTVTVEVAAVAGGRVRISVIDTGIGIPEEKLGELFRPFHRLESTAQNVEGSGIGLALTRSLVHAMDGEIDVTSVPGRGSTFWMELPAASEMKAGVLGETPSKLELPVARGPGHEQCLLYVEDNPANVLVMEEIARRMSLRFLSAPDAESGIEIAVREKPDLIVMDINLPRMDGYGALAALNKNPATAEIPVMALSANAMDQDVMRGIAAGFVKYETKPYDLEDMTRKIRQLLSEEK